MLKDAALQSWSHSIHFWNRLFLKNYLIELGSKVYDKLCINDIIYEMDK